MIIINNNNKNWRQKKSNTSNFFFTKLKMSLLSTERFGECRNIAPRCTNADLGMHLKLISLLRFFSNFRNTEAFKRILIKNLRYIESALP